MYYETIKTPSKCSHNLWIIKVNKKPEITLPAVHCIHVIKFQLESLLSTHHIFSHFDFHSLFPVKKKSNRSFSCKAPRLAFSFLPPVRFEIFTAGFSSRIFIFPLVHWLRKSDCSSLNKTLNEHWRHSRFSQWLWAAHQVIECKIYKPPPAKYKHKPLCNICKIFFDNKATELS